MHCLKKSPGVKEQKDYAKKLLSKIKTYEALCEMLTSSGRNTFLLRKDINVFTFTSYKEVFECLTGIKKDYRRDFLMLVQLFSVFLHEKGICLWPLGRFKKERIWLGSIELLALHLPKHPKELRSNTHKNAERDRQ